MQVNTGSLELRTVKLTKSILTQIPVVHRLPEGTYAPDGNLLPEKVVGWVHGSVLGDRHSTVILFNLGDGEYRCYISPHSAPKGIKQLYIV